MNKQPNRVVLGALGLGLAAMLITSVSYRLNGETLIKSTGVPAAMPTRTAMDGMPENMPPAMAEALAKQTGQAKPDMNADAMRSMMGGGNDERQGAVLELMKKLQANPDDADTLLALADEFLTKSPESAQGFINRAMVAAPADPRPPYYHGVLLAGQEKYQEAAELMERSLSLGANPSTRYSLGIIYRYHLNQPQKAAEQFNAALVSPDLTPELRALLERETKDAPQ